MWVFCCFVFFGLFQGHSTGKPERSAFSLAAQFLLCQQPLLIPGLFLHCVVIYYAVLTATPPHPPSHGATLHPLLRTMVGRGPWLTHTPYQPLNFVERKVWTVCLTFQSQSLLLFSLKFREVATLKTGLLPAMWWEMVLRFGQMIKIFFFFRLTWANVCV